MNKKIFILLLIWMQICLFAIKVSAQANLSLFTYSNLPTCILDQQVASGSAYWFDCNQGTLPLPSTDLSYSNAPTINTTGQSLSLWGFNSTRNGAFTPYKFEKDEAYRVCFWVRNNSGWPTNWWGRLKVNVAQWQMTGYNTWAFSRQQLADDSYFGPYNFLYPDEIHPWEFVSFTFTADDDYNSLWLYVDNPVGLPPGGPVWLSWSPYYVLEVDEIRVTKEPTTPYNVSVTNSSSVISGCNGQATITVNGMPTGTIVGCDPVPVSIAGNQITVKPCITTVYKIVVSDPTSSCGTCINEIVYDTIYVDTLADPARLSYPTVTLACKTGQLILDYDDVGIICTGVSYTWIDPDGNPNPGKQFFAAAEAKHSGEWTLQIIKPGGCIEELKCLVSVGSCCIASPQFVFNATNPVTFTHTGTGITNQVGSLWNFGDGTTSKLENPIHAYTTPGTYEVCLTTLYEDEQGEGCCNRICDVVEILDPPSDECIVIADFNYNWLNGTVCDFTDASAGSGAICHYEWDFAGTIKTANVPTYRYQFSGSGPWWVCLTATNCMYDANGTLIDDCTDEKCMWVYPPPPMVSNPVSGAPALRDQSQPAKAVVPPATTSADEPGNNTIMIFPNPNYGTFSLSLHKRTGSYNVVVRDKLGREVYKSEHIFNNEPVKITLNNVSNGVYSVEVMNDKEKFVQQVSITR